MRVIDAAILGVVEGITEYLPVSSTGHLILTAWLLGLDTDPETKKAVDAFNVIIQGGAILAVLGLYRQRVGSMLLGLVGRDRDGRRLLGRIFVAFLPAAVLGPVLDDRIEALLFSPVPVLGALAAGGVVLIATGPWLRRIREQDEGPPLDPSLDRRSLESLTVGRAALVGAFQVVAMWPGTSRSMMTILGGLATGLRPKDAAEFSFLLGLPTLGGACVFKAVKATLRHDGGAAGFLADLGGVLPVAVGLLVSTLTAAVAVRWLVGYLTRRGLALFGWWRLILSAALGFGIAQGLIELNP